MSKKKKKNRKKDNNNKKNRSNIDTAVVRLQANGQQPSPVH